MASVDDMAAAVGVVAALVLEGMAVSCGIGTGTRPGT